MTANVKVGGHTGMNPRVPDVETLICSKATTSAVPDLYHELENDSRGVTMCRWCGRSWAALDAEART